MYTLYLHHRQKLDAKLQVVDRAKSALGDLKMSYFLDVSVADPTKINDSFGSHIK